MKLPNANQAIVEIEKLRSYSLSPEHPVGKHKARVFAAALSLDQTHAEEMRERLLQAASAFDCVPTKNNAFGQTYEMDFMLTHESRSALVRAVWIIRPNEDSPRLVTFHVL